MPYCVIQIGNAGDIAEREASRFDPTPHPGASHHMYVNPGSITASTTFDALFAGRAGGCREDAEWYFVGDDDTLFFHRGIVRFATQRRRQVTMKVAHGNEFNPTLAKKGWFTGGSGVALSRGMAEAAETRRAASGISRRTRRRVQMVQLLRRAVHAGFGVGGDASVPRAESLLGLVPGLRRGATIGGGHARGQVPRRDDISRGKSTPEE